MKSQVKIFGMLVVIALLLAACAPAAAPQAAPPSAGAQDKTHRLLAGRAGQRVARHQSEGHGGPMQPAIKGVVILLAVFLNSGRKEK